MRGTGLRVLRQQSGHIRFDLFFQVDGQRQAPVVEQMVIDARRTQLLGTRVADEQHLTAFFEALGMPLLEAVVNARAVSAAKPVGLPVQPGRGMLRPQTTQAAAEDTCGKAFEQG